MKRIALVLMAAFAIALAGAGSVSAAPHVGNPGGNCDDGLYKVETSNGSIVLAAGTVFCVKQENSNTGTLVADGVTTLAQYAGQAGLNPGVSNYVVYQEATPSPTPSTTPSATPSPTATPTPTPTSTPTFTPSPTPSVEPTPTPTPSETPTSTPTPSNSPTSTPEPSTSPRVSIPTPPPTDTEAVENLANVATVAIGVWIALAVIGALAAIGAFVYIGRRIR